MKFTALEDFRHGHALFEAGNTYDCAKHGVSDDEARSFRANGWAEVEGMDPAPARQVRGVSIEPASNAHGQKAQEA